MNKSISKKQRSKGKKKQYRVRNWREYNESLINRGRITFWINEEAIKSWQEQKKTGKRGKPRIFSNMAIETTLTLREILHLPLRQTEGFLTSILKKMSLDIKSPDYSTLSIRGEILPIILPVRINTEQPLHVVIDSTGAKVYGEGEWKVRQHGWSKRRTWKKLHIGIDDISGDILLGEVTDNNTADCRMLKPLLKQLPKEIKVKQVSADGAYDKRICYQSLLNNRVHRIAIPPQHNAKIWKHGNCKGSPLPRDQNLRQIRIIGLKQWKVASRYNRRSLAETAIFRFKTIFSDKVSARKAAGQRTQLLLRCRILNRMTALGMPKSYLVA